MDSQNEARARMRSSISRKNAMICSALCAALVGYGTKAAFAVDCGSRTRLRPRWLVRKRGGGSSNATDLTGGVTAASSSERAARYPRARRSLTPDDHFADHAVQSIQPSGTTANLFDYSLQDGAPADGSDLLNTVAANFPQRSSSTGKSTINKMLTGDGLSGGGRIKQFEFKASFTDTDESPLSGAFRYVATDKAGLVPRRPDKGSRKAFEAFARHG